MVGDKTSQLDAAAHSCLQISDVITIYLIGLGTAVVLIIWPCIRLVDQLRTLAYKSATGRKALRLAIRELRKTTLFRNKFRVQMDPLNLDKSLLQSSNSTVSSPNSRTGPVTLISSGGHSDGSTETKMPKMSYSDCSNSSNLTQY